MPRTVLAFALVALRALPAVAQTDPNDLSARVEIIRTEHGVPHIRAQDLKAFGYALAWVMLEDYGPRTAQSILRVRGTMARVYGRDSIGFDFAARPDRKRAEEVYHRLDQGARDVYEGFAAGLNRYVTMHRDQFVAGFPADFSGYDVAAQDVQGPNLAFAARFVARLGMGDSTRGRAPRGEEGADDLRPNEGSNAWALAPSRTRSKHAILLRNPHLDWESGYYEAHVTVPGVLDFYGDFRIGGPFVVIGGFNKDLGFATTNNNSLQDAVYALDVVPGATDQVMLDGLAMPLTREAITVEFKNGPGYSSETRERWRSPLGPVIARAGGKVYILRTATDGEYRAGEQFLRMMQATSLAEWKAAMRVNARSTSNFTYADRAGNIFYVWNATLPAYPHPMTRDSGAFTPIARTEQAWTRLVPWDSLPQLQNPKGGYIHQENDPPHFTNLLQPMDSASLPATVPGPALSLRSQLALEILTGAKRKVTLEDVIRMKHTYKMLLADRVKPDLLAAIRGANDPALAEAERVLAAWDNTTAPESRGGVLFEAWWRRYRPAGTSNAQTYAVVWSKEAPTSTPRGLADPARALTALRDIIPRVRERFGRLDPAWGDQNRVQVGGKDVPVGGCGGDLGCFRVLQFDSLPDGRRAASGGDGWILAVEFGPTPRAYSVLAYGESNQPGSPWNGDQGEMFAKGQLKKVRFTQADIDAGAVKRYRPGQDP